MLTLPPTPRRAQLKAFWLSLCLTLAMVGSLVLSLIGAPHSFAMSLGAAFVLACAGLAGVDRLRDPYALWNQIAKRVARRARLLLMAVYYFAVFRLVRFGGTRFRREPMPVGTSGWMRRPNPSSMLDSPNSGESRTNGGSSPWLQSYLRWGVSKRNLWALSLLPFLIVLALLAENEDDTLPAHVYTLF